jgi:hypothetical protein
VVHSAGFSKGGQWPQLLSSKRRDSANVVQDHDADLGRHHPVVPPVDQHDGRLDAGEVLTCSRATGSPIAGASIHRLHGYHPLGIPSCRADQRHILGLRRADQFAAKRR